MPAASAAPCKWAVAMVNTMEGRNRACEVGAHLNNITQATNAVGSETSAHMAVDGGISNQTPSATQPWATSVISR